MANDAKNQLTVAEGVLIGSVVAFGVIAFWVYQETKRCDQEVKKLTTDIEAIQFAIQRNEEQVRIGNTALLEGNEILRGMVKEQYAIQT